jgi:uroporphyrinogen-III synthase
MPIVARAVIATIGPTTSAAVRELGWHEPVEAAHATTDGIIAALDAHFESVIGSSA